MSLLEPDKMAEMVNHFTIKFYYKIVGNFNLQVWSLRWHFYVTCSGGIYRFLHVLETEDFKGSVEIECTDTHSDARNVLFALVSGHIDGYCGLCIVRRYSTTNREIDA